MSVAAQAARLLGTRLEAESRLAGGDLSAVVALRLVDGREAVAKTGPAPRVEARMLDAIRAAGAPAPEVLACDDNVLVLGRLREDGRLGLAWPDLGRVLARLHACRGPRYGWETDYAFGRVAIENAQASNGARDAADEAAASHASDDWAGFWAERRLLNQLTHLPARVARRIEALAADLGNRLPRAPAASLLHGDLWSGNVLADRGRIAGLIDPACYYGHCEVDLAMLQLFGQPGRDFFAAYGPQDPGHPERLPIYQLWPALVHYRLFGAGYLALVERLLDATGA